MKILISMLIIIGILLVGTSVFAKTNMEMAKECLKELNIVQYYGKIVSVRVQYLFSSVVSIYIVAETKKSNSPVLIVARYDKKIFGRGPWRLLRVNSLTGEDKQ